MVILTGMLGFWKSNFIKSTVALKAGKTEIHTFPGTGHSCGNDPVGMLNTGSLTLANIDLLFSFE